MSFPPKNDSISQRPHKSSGPLLKENGGPRRARILLVTLRGLTTHAAWCSNFEFEDVIRSVDDVDVLELESAPLFELRQHIARSIAWRSSYRAFTDWNPGVKPVKLTRDYDVLVFVCMNVWDLLYLNAVVDWQTRCHVKLCYMAEIYTGQIDELQHLLRRLADFDQIFQSFSSSVDAISKIVSRPCHRLSHAVDVLRFTPYPKPPARAIDVLSIGRRSEAVHQALRQLAADRNFFYMYDTLPSPLVRPSKPIEHREMLAGAARRSRFFKRSLVTARRRDSQKSGPVTLRERQPARSCSDRRRPRRHSVVTSLGPTRWLS